jgi:hypothetical protein
MVRRVAVLLATAAILAVSLTGVYPLSRKARAQVPSLFGATRFPSIGVDRKNKLYLMMSVATAPASERRPHSQIFFTKSSNSGVTWDNLPETRNLTNSPGEAFGPSIAVTQTGTVRVYVTYQDNSSGTTQIFLIRSKKKAKFRKPQNITPHDGGAFSPRVALDSQENVNVVWGDFATGERKVMFERSTDLGATFGDPVDIGRSSGQAFEPEIAIGPDDAINVVWEDTAPGQSVIMFARSTDGGQTFSEPRQVSTGTGDATEGQISIDETGRISVVWIDQSPGNPQAFYARSSNNGSSFSVPINVTNDDRATVEKPLSVVSQGIVYVAYQDETEGHKQVFLVRSGDAGATFSRPVQVSNADNNCGRAHSASMTIDKHGTLHIVWIDASRVIPCADEGLLFYSNTTNGRTFSPQLMILAAID